MAIVPAIPNIRLTANSKSANTKVSTAARTGTAYQRGERKCGRMILGYTTAVHRGEFAGGFTAGKLTAVNPLVYKRTRMSQAATAITRSPADVVRMTPVSQAANGVCYATSGENSIGSIDLERMIVAVPAKIASALKRKAYYFVPLTVSHGDETLIADRYDVALSDNAVCHRNLNLGDSQCVFISTRLSDDKFSVSFEFYINVGHALVEVAGVSREFSDLAWKQVEAGVRGETSLDAWESRKLVTAGGPDVERYRNEYFEATFADTISIYLLSLFLDLDYHDLRERDYPLLAPSALAERLRKIAELFPPNPGFEFSILYKRRS